MASEISKDIINEIRNEATENAICVINLPDNINGSFIFRHGLQSALNLFAKEKNIQSVEIISNIDLKENDVSQVQ